MRFSEITSTPLLTETDLRICRRVIVNEQVYFITEADEIARNKYLSSAMAALQITKDKAVSAITDPVGTLKSVGKQIATQVRNGADALKLLFVICTDPTKQIKATVELKKLVDQKINSFNQKIQTLIKPLVPTGTTLKDFFKLLVLYTAILGLIAGAKALGINLTGDFAIVPAIQALLSPFSSITDNLINAIVASGGAQILVLLQGLKLSHEVFFNVLSYIYGIVSRTINLAKTV